MTGTIIDPDTMIGLVRLKVRNLETSIAFYEEVIGFKVLRREQGVAELTANGITPLLVLEENEKLQVMPERSVSGLYHFAILVPNRRALGLSLRNLIKHKIPVGQGDHLVSEALYLNDPDQNGIEIYADRPREAWQRNSQGEYLMATDPVDIEGLLNISEDGVWKGLEPKTVIGHVHFHVGDLSVAKQFYCDVLGFEITLHYGNAALFISAGGYHHHIGLNTWAGTGAPPNPEDAVGLRYFTISLPNQAALDEVVSRLSESGILYQEHDHEVTLSDPFGIGIKLVITNS
ncbi:Catechol-2,3-dioxygenase [compost metagenome]